VIGVMILGMTLSGEHGGMPSQAFGYLTMLVALSSIFIAVKRHRDNVRGGVIKFLPAFAMGLGIAAVAGVAYVAVWEIYLAATDYSFMESYVQAQIAALEARGVSGEELEAAVRQMEQMQEAYASLWFRIPVTFAEIFHVGLIVAAISAALLRNPRFAPKR
jgi:hypothetical protein